MKAFALALALTATAAQAYPNSGATMTLTVPAGQHLRSLATATGNHPMYDACKGPAKDASRVKQVDGSTVWTFTCR